MTMTTCPRCGCECRMQAHDHAHCVQCFTSFRPSAQGPRLPYECQRCGQLSGDDRVCDACRAQDREPQGETVRLFQPAPTQMPGEATMELARPRRGSFYCRHCGTAEAMPGHAC